MRQLKPSAAHAQRGLTLVEVMVAFAILSLLALAAAPAFSDYGTNSRLRESGNTLYAETLFAQSEAIKRNTTVRVAVAGSTVTVTERSDIAAPTTLRTREFASGVTATTAGNVDFGSQGWPAGFNAVSLNLSHATATCSTTHRCPGLRVQAGGAVRLCADRTAVC